MRRSKAFGGGARISLCWAALLAGARRERRQRGRRERREIYAVLRHEFESAMNRHVGGAAKYRAAEGKTLNCRCRGRGGQYRPRYPGGLRQLVFYVGASRLKELTKRTTFIRVQEQENRIFNSSNILAGVMCASLIHPAHRVSQRKIGKYIATTSTDNCR